MKKLRSLILVGIAALGARKAFGGKDEAQEDAPASGQSGATPASATGSGHRFPARAGGKATKRGTKAEAPPR